MSEDKELKQWKEKLFYQPKNGYDRIDAEQAGEIFAYAEGYKQFLDAARTEREAVKGDDGCRRYGGGRSRREYRRRRVASSVRHADTPYAL